MTPFELWRAGLGEEPVVVAEERVRLLDWASTRLLPPYHLYSSGIRHDREEAAATEEMGMALERAMGRDDRLAVARILNAEINLVAGTMDRYKAGSDGWNSAKERLATLEALRLTIADAIGWPTTEELCEP